MRRDDVRDALRPLRELEWRNEAHRRALEHRLRLATPARPSRLRRLRLLAAAVIAAALLGGGAVAFAGDLAGVREWFEIEILGVERRDDGAIESMEIDTGDGRATLQPFVASPDQIHPRDREFDVDVVGGGVLRLRVLTPGTPLMARWMVAVHDSEADVAAGKRMRVVEIAVTERTIERIEGGWRIRIRTDAGERSSWDFEAAPDRPGVFVNENASFEVVKK